MADTDRVGLDEHLVGSDLRVVDLGNDGFVGSLEDEGLHRSPRS